MKTLSSLICSLGLATSAGLLTFSAHAQDTKPGDPSAGQKKIAMCVGCHGILGYRASFPEVHRVPKISGQSAKYISAALNQYKKGDRKHPTMRGIASSLNDQDIADISAFYEADGKHQTATAAKSDSPGTATPSAEVNALLTKGNCAACHGKDLDSPIDGTYPKLAGQYADYVFVALKAYQIDKNPQIGRSNAVMSTQAKLFNHAELKLLARYVESLPGTIKTVPEARMR